MKWKFISLALTLLLAITNGFWLYSTFDTGVTLSYHDQVTYEFANRIKKLNKLCNHFIIGLPSDSMKIILNHQSKSDIVFEKDSALHALWISISVFDGKVAGIKNDDLVEEWSKTKDNK